MPRRICTFLSNVGFGLQTRGSAAERGSRNRPSSLDNGSMTPIGPSLTDAQIQATKAKLERHIALSRTPISSQKPKNFYSSWLTKSLLEPYRSEGSRRHSALPGGTPAKTLYEPNPRTLAPRTSTLQEPAKLPSMKQGSCRHTVIPPPVNSLRPCPSATPSPPPSTT